jgi:hypothetical protein
MRRPDVDEAMRDVETFIRGTIERAPKSRPGGFYSPEGDCVYFFDEDVAYRCERVDGLLTVFRAEDDGRIVGVLIKDVSELPRHDLVKVMVESKSEVEIVMLLLATYERQDSPAGRRRDRIDRYVEAIGAFGTRVPAKGLGLAGR